MKSARGAAEFHASKVSAADLDEVNAGIAEVDS
jgi:hypothetical protein